MLFFKTQKQNKNSRTYFDYASSTPRDTTMVSSFDTLPQWCSGANPSSLHKEGVEIKKYLTKARILIAQTIGAHQDEIFFTSGATESITTALEGVLAAHSNESIAFFTSELEHSVTKRIAEKNSVSVYYIEQREGVVDPQSIYVPEGVSHVLISLIMVQNEIGTLQPISSVAKRIRKLKKEYPSVTFCFHIDATQAPLYYSLDVRSLGVDMMSIGATKLYCTKGVGFLYCARGVRRIPLLRGSQEYGMRAGTEPVELIYECAQAFHYAQIHREHAFSYIKELQSYCEEQLTILCPEWSISGKDAERTPHITHVTYKGIDSELFVLELDARGFALSSKSACTNEDESVSDIVEVLYPKEKRNALRISYGRNTTRKSIDALLCAIKDVLKKYQ